MIWFTADTHFGHKNIIKYCNRPFDSIEQMDQTIIDAINNNVQPNDVLWHLGDFCFAPRKKYYDIAKFYRYRIFCKNIGLIFGNHDRAIIRELFCWSHKRYRFKIDDISFVLHHKWFGASEKNHTESIYLYGHSHGNCEDWLDKMIPNIKSLDVGVDNAYKLLGEFRPFSLQEIFQIVENRQCLITT